MTNESDTPRAGLNANSPGARRAERHLWYATLTVTLASGVMSTIGVYEVLAANRAYGFSLSLLVGLVITAMLSGAWGYLFHALPRAQGAALVNLTLLLVPFLALVFLISTWTNATAVVGGPALNMHNRQFLNEYERALEAANRRVEASARTLAALRAEAGAFRADVEGEIGEGRLTGYVGRGVVSGTLEQIADKLDGVVAEAEAALLGRRVVLTVQDVDAYGRMVAQLSVEGEGHMWDVSATLARLGLAWLDPRYGADRESLREDQKLAQSEGIGLWSQPNPVPPWDWRRPGKAIVLDAKATAL